MLRTLVVIVAVFALVGGWLQLFAGFVLLGSGLLMLTVSLPKEITEAAQASPQGIGFSLAVVAVLTVLSGVAANIFAIGALMRKLWARWLGIGCYALNIVVGVMTMLLAYSEEQRFSYLVGLPLAMIFMIILIFSKSAFEKPLR